MSMPLATMSVATSTSFCPDLNSYITSSRSCCVRSLCIWQQFILFFFSSRAISFTLSFLPENMITRFRRSFLNRFLISPIF